MDMEYEDISTVQTGGSHLVYVEPASEDDLKEVDARLRIPEREMAVTQAGLADVRKIAEPPESTAGIRELRRQLQNQVTLIGVLSALCLGLTVSFVTVVLTEVI